MTIQAHLVGVKPIFVQILPIVRYSIQACWLPEKLVKLVFSDAQMTATNTALAGGWSCVSLHWLPMFISMYIQWLSKWASHTASQLKCTWNGRCAKRNCIHLKISLWYNVPKICELSSIQLSSPSLESTSERSFGRASANWNEHILKLSSPHCRWQSTQA